MKYDNNKMFVLLQFHSAMEFFSWKLNMFFTPTILFTRNYYSLSHFQMSRFRQLAAAANREQHQCPIFSGIQLAERKQAIWSRLDLHTIVDKRIKRVWKLSNDSGYWPFLINLWQCSLYINSYVHVCIQLSYIRSRFI